MGPIERSQSIKLLLSMPRSRPSMAPLRLILVTYGSAIEMIILLVIVLNYTTSPCQVLLSSLSQHFHTKQTCLITLSYQHRLLHSQAHILSKSHSEKSSFLLLLLRSVCSVLQKHMTSLQQYLGNPPGLSLEFLQPLTTPPISTSSTLTLPIHPYSFYEQTASEVQITVKAYNSTVTYIARNRYSLNPSPKDGAFDVYPNVNSAGELVYSVVALHWSDLTGPLECAMSYSETIGTKLVIKNYNNNFIFSVVLPIQQDLNLHLHLSRSRTMCFRCR